MECSPSLLAHEAQLRLLTDVKSSNKRSKANSLVLKRKGELTDGRLYKRFKCACKQRDCYQGIVDADRAQHRESHQSFDEARRAADDSRDASRHARMSLLFRIQKRVLPKVGGNSPCRMSVRKITGRSNSWFYPRSPNQKDKRNISIRNRRARILPSQADKVAALGDNKDVHIMAWFIALIPILDRMPDQAYYQEPATDKLQVYNWYMAASKEAPDLWHKCL